MNNTLLLVGNANTGKTTLFNAMTKKNQKTGNWHGVTNSEFFGEFKIDDKQYTLVDLPGIYSLSPLSFEEKVATDCILANTDKICLNICEQSNITRNLYLTLQLLEAGIQTILIVNTKNKMCFLNIDLLSKKLGIPVVEFKNKNSIKNIKQTIKNFKSKKINCNYFDFFLKQNNFDLLEKESCKIDILAQKDKKKGFFDIFKNNKKYKSNCDNCTNNCENNCANNIGNSNGQKNCLNKKIDFLKLDKNFIKIKLLEHDECFLEKYESPNERCSQIANIRYNFIHKVLSNQNIPNKVYGKNKLDKILLNKYLALPIFFVVLIAVFYLTFFSLGSFLGSLLENFIGQISNIFLNLLSIAKIDGWFLDMIDGAIFGGIGSVLSFLPQICLLFVFLSILEDSGYLSRVAFLFEDVFSKIGLSGKGVYTLLMGFGCSATSIMTARNMEDKNAKTKIALITPYFSCSAKLPIYAVIGGAFFGAGNVFVIFGLYLTGVVLGLLLCALLNKTVWKSKQQSFILEFAPLQFVSVQRLTKVVWENIKQFLIRIGSLIVCINVIVWIVSNFSFGFRYVQIYNCESMIESLGKFFAPVFVPLGFGNWGAVSALIAGIIAKEIVVSSIAIFNGVDHNESKFAQSLTSPMSAVFFTPQSALSFLVFCLLYTPCVSALAVLKSEFGTKFAVLSFVSQFAIAYLCSFTVYNILMSNFWLVLAEFVVLVALYLIVFKICGKIKQKHKQRAVLEISNT